MVWNREVRWPPMLDVWGRGPKLYIWSTNNPWQEQFFLPKNVPKCRIYTIIFQGMQPQDPQNRIRPPPPIPGHAFWFPNMFSVPLLRQISMKINREQLSAEILAEWLTSEEPCGPRGCAGRLVAGLVLMMCLRLTAVTRHRYRGRRCRCETSVKVLDCGVHRTTSLLYQSHTNYINANQFQLCSSYNLEFSPSSSLNVYQPWHLPSLKTHYFQQAFQPT